MLSRPWSRRTARRRLAWLRRSAVAGTLTLAMLHGDEVEAQAPVAVGEAFQVNTYTSDLQRFPQIAMDDEGDFVITWQSGYYHVRGPDGSGFGIYAQRYRADGTPLDSEFQVNTYTTNSQDDPAIAMDADGDFVIAWTSYGQGGNGQGGGIYAQRYNADGIAQGPEFRVSTSTTRQVVPTVAMDTDGDFAIAWSSKDQDGDGFGVYAQRFTATGTPDGPEFQVNTYTTDDQLFPSVAMDASGDFIIAWQSGPFNGPGQDGSAYGIYAQRYRADGTPRGLEFRVNSCTTSKQSVPSVSVDADGGFVIAWESECQEAGSYNIQAQRYEADGTPRGTEFRVNTCTTDSQRYPCAGVDAQGNVVITWYGQCHEFGPDADRPSSRSAVYAQRYLADGTPQGSEFYATTSSHTQQVPSVGIANNGGFVITWLEYHDSIAPSVYHDVFARRFAASPVANEDDATLPTDLALDAVFPNPVRNAATLRYALPMTAAVHLSVTDVLGRTVLTRAEGVQPAGQHEARLGLADLPNGVYVVRLDAAGVAATRRVTLVH